jgi:tRNA 2-thiouridine synthesizing protein A
MTDRPGPVGEGVASMDTLEVSATPEVEARVDARGLSCPMPIVRTAQAIKTVASGALVEVLATDPGSLKDFTAWCRSTGNELIEQTSDAAVYRFVIRKK